MEGPQLTRARWRHTKMEEVVQAVFSVGPLRSYMTRPTIAKIRYQETSSEDTAEE
jgi:hypothetical protein